MSFWEGRFGGVGETTAGGGRREGWVEAGDGGYGSVEDVGKSCYEKERLGRTGGRGGKEK